MGGITLDRDGAVAVIRFDRPDKLNALTLAMYEELGAAFDEVRDDDAIAVAVLTGSGDRAFCVGADLAESIPALAEGRFDISEWDGAHQKHTTLFKPVIAAVNGLCLGGGFEIMLSTEIRIAAETAEFGLPETGVGVVPAGGTLTRLARQIPYVWAMELMLEGDRITAERALRYGLLNEVVPAAQLMDTALRRAHRLTEKSGTALATVKEAVLRLGDLPQDQAFHSEALYGQKAFTSADARAGLDAFAARRRPDFPSRRGSTPSG
ncbi:enoyl-CoA hydratase/isomerase family protein [Amycolatopsis rubida]|uniref:Enoyl-CoA hydratase n=1 Tax=Amycolatopsis rubida TaxID=112413 RepID=A0A1I5TVX4_9PSEU|nr:MULTISPECIES: enoyl-CoA hydratase-related protein [Amycolatopsis]MYW93617.1 enoyl-CoA hydratase/isomerase family protein [Amycolatopsis rubida]NEC58604.1 enoyl-CoA hydratase/isomerase family protein [Amycolatopsis rubida]OAP22693.1 Carnitinyl-CoA dehydratase [Amycolatopsis sp. M39]SFP87159.1 enoyl-CoA hydratase [Amycolatopsis rubida]